MFLPCVLGICGGWLPLRRHKFSANSAEGKDFPTSREDFFVPSCYLYWTSRIIALPKYQSLQVPNRIYPVGSGSEESKSDQKKSKSKETSGPSDSLPPNPLPPSVCLDTYSGLKCQLNSICSRIFDWKRKKERKKERFVDWKKAMKIEKPCTQIATKGSAIWTLQRWIWWANCEMPQARELWILGLLPRWKDNNYFFFLLLFVCKMPLKLYIYFVLCMLIYLVFNNLTIIFQVPRLLLWPCSDPLSCIPTIWLNATLP